MIPEPAVIYIMDRAYLDFEQLFTLHDAGAFFVTRAKSNSDLRRVYSAPSDRAQGIICAAFTSKILRQGKRSSF